MDKQHTPETTINICMLFMPVTGWILREEILVQICKLDFTSSILPILTVAIE